VTASLGVSPGWNWAGRANGGGVVVGGRANPGVPVSQAIGHGIVVVVIV